ncbi:MAG: hypothetical protein DRZ82_06860 [Thermoprotei archaeon]|nr:MAG: hypothetical protein DRZ82_06860 [Thermoprotei archaeon]
MNVSSIDIERYFRRLFVLPSVYRLVLLIMIPIATYFISCFMLSFYHTKYFIEGLILLIFTILSPYLIPLLWHDKKTYNPVRISMIAFLSATLFVITFLITMGKTRILGLSPSLYLQLLVVQLISGSSLVKNIILEGLSIIPSFWLTLHINAYNKLTYEFLLLLLTFSLPILAVNITLSYLRHYSSIIKMDLLALGRGFARMWLEGDSSHLEKELFKICETAEVQVHYIKFYNKGKLTGIIVVPEFHYGPFRNLGSSQFPAVLSYEIKEHFKCDGIALHGASSHERNLASSADVKKVLSSLFKALRRSNRILVRNEGIIDPVKIRGHDFEIIGIALGKIAILVVSALDKGIEDIPSEYWELAKKLGVHYGFEDVILVDAHNGLLSENIDFAELSDLISKSLRELSLKKREPVKFSMVTKRVPIKEELGIGRAGLSVIYLEGLRSKRKLVFVVVDGNNVVPEFRCRLKRFLMERFNVDLVELLTTDTHSVSGFLSSSRGYFAIGELPEHNILYEIAAQCLDQAIKSCSVSSFECNVITIKSVKIYGGLLSKMYAAVAYGYEALVKRGIPISLIFLTCIILLLSSTL